MSRKVVHCKKHKYDLYVGRPSQYGNPFSHLDGTLAKYKVNSREEAIEAYEKWLYEPEQKELLEDIKKNLKGLVLSCWCFPLACHADILVKIANNE
ncbi:MAG: DUF4326 domain-containing protein [Chitinophagales bacterium]|nr:DUF4326 domain-containing protein [Chitinophagales bacterium]